MKVGGATSRTFPKIPSFIVQQKCENAFNLSLGRTFILKVLLCWWLEGVSVIKQGNRKDAAGVQMCFWAAPYFRQSQVTSRCDSVILKMLWMALAARICLMVSEMTSADSAALTSMEPRKRTMKS